MTEQEKKTLKDVFPDIERYFEEDCYCPNEVYSIDRFGYYLVYADSPCEIVGTFSWNNGSVTLVKTVTNQATDKDRKAILMNVWHENGRVTDAERYDLSEENVKNIIAYLKGECDHFKLTEEDDLAKDIANLLGLCNGVIIV